MWIWRYYYTKKNWNIKIEQLEKTIKNMKKQSIPKQNLRATMPCVIGAYKCHPSPKPMNRDIHLERPFGQQNISPALRPRKRIWPLKMDGSRMKFLLKWSIFRDMLLFRRVYVLNLPTTQLVQLPSPEIPLPLMESWTSQRTWPIHFRAIPWEKNPTRLNNMCTWWFKLTFLGWLSDPFKGLSDLQLGDKKVTLNHLVTILLLQTLAQTNTVGFAEGWFRARCKWQNLLMKIYHSARQKRTFHHVLPLLRRYVAMPWYSMYLNSSIPNHLEP